jgi:hypothetical protein
MAGGGGGGGGQKQDDLAPHPVKDQLPGVSYCITSPPPWRQYLFSLPPHPLVPCPSLCLSLLPRQRFWGVRSCLFSRGTPLATPTRRRPVPQCFAVSRVVFGGVGSWLVN